MKLLAFLGTGIYNETEYVWNGQAVISRYAIVASARFARANSAIIFATEEARQTHEDPLREALQKVMPENSSANFVPVKRGETETELWSIFAQVAQAVQKNEEITFDVTHGLRSFPLIGLLAAAFLRAAFSIQLRHVFYGAFDVRDQSVTPHRTPMFDLTPLLTLLEWAVAADRFNRTGDARYFASLLREQQKRLALQAQNQPEHLAQIGKLGSLASALTNISQSLALIRPHLAMMQIANLPAQADAALPVLAEAEAVLPFRLVLDATLETYRPLGLADPFADTRRDLETQRQLIAWYAEREHWPQAVSLAREWLVSWVMAHLGMKNLTSLSDRHRIEGVVNSEAEEFLKAKTTGQVFQAVFLKSLPQVETVLGLWKSLTNVRNDIDHAGMRENPLQPQDLIEQVRNHINAINSLPLDSIQ